MNWNQLYGLRSYLKASLWIVPFIAIPLELIVIRILHPLDEWLGWTLLGLGRSGAEAMLQAMVSSTLAFLVFTFGSLLVAIQVASAQLTPRIIATTLLRNDVVKYTVGIFIFTLMFAISAQNRIDKDVPELLMVIAAGLLILCFGAFLYLIDYASRLLRPITILGHVGDAGLAVIDGVYPAPSAGPNFAIGPRLKLGTPSRVVHHRGTSGIVLAVNLNVLMAQAERANCVVEFAPLVGDFVAVDEPLFNLYGDAESISDQILRAAVAFGSERSLDQDPTFAIRIIVDIALRALSPAINDPTTGVLAIDQLHRMLRMIGLRNLRTDEILDSTGRLRLIFRTPNWEDFVHLSFSEIRSCGSNNLQIVRRLRAMIENLMKTLPAHRHVALQQQLSLLDREAARTFGFPEDLALANVPDTQGLGGHSGINAS